MHEGKVELKVAWPNQASKQCLTIPSITPWKSCKTNECRQAEFICTKYSK